MDKPWLIRTYAGHSSAKKSNELYLKNLSKGQTGISVAFDLPTQTGYDSDHILSKGEVGKVGVPISHIGDMRSLFNQIPLDKMNTSMTINATAAWLLSLYIAVADEQGIERRLFSKHFIGVEEDQCNMSSETTPIAFQIVAILFKILAFGCILAIILLSLEIVSKHLKRVIIQ